MITPLKALFSIILKSPPLTVKNSNLVGGTPVGYLQRVSVLILTLNTYFVTLIPLPLTYLILSLKFFNNFFSSLLVSHT